MSTRARGMSLVELTVAISVLVGTLLLVQELIGTTQHAQVFIAARDRAAQQSAKLVGDLRSAGLSSRRLFQDDAEGRSYLAALTATTYPILADTRLPVVDPAGRLEPDTAGARRTGDALLLACEDRPREFVTGANRHRVDIVRFFAVYPTRRVGRVVDAMPDRLDLVRFASRPYVDRASLDAITDPAESVQVVLALRAGGITRAWTPGALVSGSFFDLNATGTVDTTPVASPVIDTVAGVPERPMLGDSNSSVAPNNPVLRVPAFAQLDNTIPSFPSGFEVKVVGPSGGRQVLVRLTLLTGANAGPDAASTTERLFSVRDL
jgi:type II secretory pathway pseudopilin PulG